MLGQGDPSGRLAAADEAFAYAQYPQALEGYTALYQAGLWQEQMLYRLAWLHEQAGSYPAAIYYLRQVQWAYGGERIEEKVADLMAQQPARLPVGSGWTAYRQALHHQRDRWYGLMLASTLLAAGLWIGWRQRWGFWAGLLPALLALGAGGMLVEQAWRLPRKAVILEPSACYEAPGFAAPYRHLPLGPGATVTLEAVTDIWCRVTLPPFEGWVPCHRLAPVGPAGPWPPQVSNLPSPAVSLLEIEDNFVN